MGLLNWLFGKKKKQKIVRLESGHFEFDMVGESFYQNNLEEICGGKTEESAEFECEAVLIPESDSPYDKNAVRVEIEFKQVGHLSRQHAEEYRKILGDRVSICDAVIVGGWDRGSDDQGHFGVKLDIDWPPAITE
jgi:hypothetical protein